jgi:ComF family protein
MAAPLYASGPGDVTPPGDRGLLDRVLHALLPAPCLGCGDPLPARGSALGLCAACRAALRPPPEETPQTTRLLALDRLLALWSYQPPLDEVILGLKFRRLDYLGGHLAAALADAMGEELAVCDAVVPVPLHWRRRLARGYNQAERIARPLADRLGRPLVAALARRHATPPQSRLGRAGRLVNLDRAFTVRKPGKVGGLRLLLVDDVATTGATLEAAAAALRAAGAASVTAVVAGRTPLETA